MVEKIVAPHLESRLRVPSGTLPHNRGTAIYRRWLPCSTNGVNSDDPRSLVHMRNSCALCSVVIDWRNCGSVLGMWEFGWDSFVYIFTYSVQSRGHWGPSIIML